MRNDIYPINHLPPVIPVGIQSEHGVREVRFDVSPWLEVWPGMYCEVWNTRPGESEAYRTVSVMEGDILTWNVNEVDTEKEGLGKVEIVGMTPDGERKKHAGPVDTAVKATSIAMTQEMPESHVPYYEAMMASNADAKAVTGENARVAQEAAEDAGQHSNDAATSAQNAEKAAQAAKVSENAADTSAKNAWEATKKMPIVGENGNWYVWSPSTGSYTDSGVPAQGPEGEKEMFFVTITTGSNGKLTSTQSYGNILYADQEGKFIVGRLDGAWPLEFVGSVEGGVMFRHIRYYSANANEPTICAEEFVVKPNGEVTWSTRTWKAPNPHPLTITGATSATYDGSSAVTLDVPDVLVVTTSVVDGKNKANYTSEEFRAAYHNNIALLIMSQVCYIFSGYESLLPKFARPAFVTNMNRIRHEYATIGADGFITSTSNEYGIRNPQSLVFTGAVNATYDGGSRVTVNIPAGGGGGGGSIPDPGTAHQQLVSDADGKAVWNDRTHYTEYADVVVLEQTTLPVGTDEGMAYLTEAPIAEPTDGGEYNVKWNGADYTCKAAKTEMDGIACVMIGNAMAFGGDDTGEPFVALFLPADTAATLGAYAMIVPLDGSAEIVLSISGKSEVVHKLHEKYLPNLPTNLANGSTPYSLRQKSATEEDAEYVLGSYASAFGYNTKAIGQQSHAEGAGTVASGHNAHAEGWDTKASSMSAHAEGFQTTASGDHSHAEGQNTTASGDASHAEGRSSKATAEVAHAEGDQTTAEGYCSHAEGKETTASEESAHAEGYKTTAEGMYSHAEGRETVSIGHGSHAEGLSTIARSEYQHVQGKFNVPELQLAGKYAHIVGNGKDANNRSNAHTLDWDGNAWYAGDVYVGGDGKDDGERLVKASEFSALSEEIEKIEGHFEAVECETGKNLFNIEAIEYGYIKADGNIAPKTDGSYITSDYMRVAPGKKLSASYYSPSYANRNTMQMRFVMFYDADKSILSYDTSNKDVLVVPDGAAYVRVSLSMTGGYAGAQEIQVELTDTGNITSYEPYGAVETSVALASDVLVPEVKDARGEYATLNDRLNSFAKTDHIKNGYSVQVGAEWTAEEENHDIAEYMMRYMAQLPNGLNGSISMGKGYHVSGGGYVVVDATNLSYFRGTDETTTHVYPHGLTVKDYLAITVVLDKSANAKITVTTNGGSYTNDRLSLAAVRRGAFFVTDSASDGVNGRFSYAAKGWGYKTHVYGDSYIGVYNDGRWPYYAVQDGYNVYFNGFSGRRSADALPVLKSVLKQGARPERILWCMGMNDTDTNGAPNASWLACVEELKTICANNAIELILATIPLVTAVDNTYKNAYVRASGYRYIDFATAVGAAEDATWYDNMLADDGTHPATEGAVALYQQVLTDVPEITMD